MNRLIRFAAGLAFAVCAFSFSACDDNEVVIGIEDATEYGYINVILEGTDPNGNDFEVKRKFKFAQSGNPQYSSSVHTYDDDGYYQQFIVTRYFGPFSGGFGSDSYVRLDLRHEEETPDFYDANLYILTGITNADKEFFTIDQTIGFTEADVTSYSYNPGTGKLSLKFKTAVVENVSGEMLTVTAEINATVFENLNPVN